MDHLLQPLLQDEVASDPAEDRCLCQSLGTPQVQADAPSNQWSERLVRPIPSVLRPGQFLAAWNQVQAPHDPLHRRKADSHPDKRPLCAQEKNGGRGEARHAGECSIFYGAKTKRMKEMIVGLLVAIAVIGGACGLMASVAASIPSS
jgi:hypothetical protein